jgi:hypothetical protein
MNTKKISCLLLVLASIILIPYIGAYINEHGDLKNYFDFPPTKRPVKINYHPLVVLFVWIVVAVILLLYFFPRLFGFKVNFISEPIIYSIKPFPVWFWIGLLAWGGAIFVLASKMEGPKWLTNWTLVPLFWGFTFILDGLVYFFNDGKSMIKEGPAEIFAMSIVSVSCWFIFEYLNFFINLNWFYPKSTIIGHDEFLLYAMVGASAFIPMSFEWYQLLRRIKILNTVYKFGPKLKFPRWLNVMIISLCFATMFITPFYRDNLFYIVWLAPVFIFAIVLGFQSIWTPFTAIKEKGDWTSLLIFALTFLIQGFLMEWWNWLSVTYVEGDNVISYNPAYWRYCIPYVQKGLIFEMPYLGYAGYLFFSIHCWIWWIVFANMMGINAKYSLHDDFK